MMSKEFGCGLPEVIRRLGDDIVFYATDVPHWDHDFPENLREMASREDLSPESRQKILGDNARRMYGGIARSA
jgi:predicted TIM-barrel fold metal-dependent hydrolase